MSTTHQAEPESNKMKIPGLFITGTDTGVGKTHFAAAIAQALRSRGVRVGAYKPVASGCVHDRNGAEILEDVEALTAAIGGGYDRERVCPQTFRAAVAPSVAARLEGTAVDAEKLRSAADWWETEVDFLIVEGAGGLLSPLSQADSNADLARDLDLPLVIVARLGLGTLNHVLLTAEVARGRGLRVGCVVLTEAAPDRGDLSRETNPAELAARCTVPILGVFPYAPEVDLWKQENFLEIDWLQLAHT
jgi:dethiobiotin synthetase